MYGFRVHTEKAPATNAKPQTTQKSTWDHKPEQLTVPDRARHPLIDKNMLPGIVRIPTSREVYSITEEYWAL